MKKIALILTLALFCKASFAQQTERVINIIPEPVSIHQKSGYFVLPDEVLILSPNIPEMSFVNSQLKEKFALAPGKKAEVRQNANNAHIELILNDNPNPTIGNEGYTLISTPQKVTIRANKPAGLLYGVQTLWQLLPPQIESNRRQENTVWKIPTVEITDFPRVTWRGLMLDVSRHFFTVDEVKQYIDNMVRYKYNMFHWHLTDDEGWRIEIKSLPKLTQVGAWRQNQIGWFGWFEKPDPDQPKDYGGYYTQDEVREIVAYALARNIQIMPEINAPGHSAAILAAYPELACFPESGDFTVRTGSPFMDWSKHPVEAIYENTLCVANENVYVFMEKVFAEVVPLFPFEYVHIGGDEAPSNFWAKSPAIHDLMARESIENMYGVQAYFTRRIELILNGLGRKAIGWDEIFDGPIETSTAVMAWRSEGHGINASNAGHYVVMSPITHTYLDLMQGDVTTEPRVYRSLRLNQAYTFDPIPEGANPKYILGGQANLWTEQVYNIRQAEYMTWPRAFAVAEAVWSPKEKKNWERFVEKTEAHFTRFDYSQTKYSPAMFDPVVAVSRDENNNYYVTLTPEISGLEIYTSFDSSTPDNFYPVYVAPQRIPRDASMMRIITYRDGKPIGRLMTITVEDLKSRVRRTAPVTVAPIE
jgi:hexosaminidase